jgi:hypothetical protein
MNLQPEVQEHHGEKLRRRCEETEIYEEVWLSDNSPMWKHLRKKIS